jgi:hypothetical protein
MLSPRLRDTVVLATLALAPYLACLGHPLFSALVLLMIFVMLVSWENTPDCHFPVHRVVRKKTFDLLHIDLWTSPVVSVSGLKYYLIILDDFTHYLWYFRLNRNLTPSPPCPIFLLMFYSIQLHYQSYAMRQRT